VTLEFHRNRANKISDAVKRLREQKLALQFPQICKQFDEYEMLRAAQKEYKIHHSNLVERIEQNAAQQSLDADTVIEELFDVANCIPNSPTLIEKARLRMDLGNPPGKKGSLGDAINWEALIEVVPDEEDLYFISDDKDFFSPLDPESIDPFLRQEWSNNKGSELHSYKRLSSLFRDHFPDIELASELEKDLLIKELAISANFADTHRVMSILSRYSDFTQSQINEIVFAAISNNQVYWIADDPDVNNFLRSVVHNREGMIDPENLRRIRSVIDEIEPYGEIPF
jgi:hypothetical protein